MTIRTVGRSVAVALLLASVHARADWVVFRGAVIDTYPDIESYERDAHDVYGLRLGLGSAIDKRVYGLSVSLLADGGFSFGAGDEETPVFVDDDFIGAKIGGFFNSSCGSGVGLQIGGIGATTDVRMSGAQIGGIFAEAQYMNGFQIAGISSVASLEMHAFQVGGLVARCGIGMAEDVVPLSTGFQISAGVAVCKGTLCGGQIGGLFAECDDLDGFQIGLVASARDVTGLQVGVCNVADALTGAQIGVFNVADTLKGVQIGLLNFTGSSERGDLFCLPVLNAYF